MRGARGCEGDEWKECGEDRAVEELMIVVKLSCVTTAMGWVPFNVGARVIEVREDRVRDS